MTAALAISQTPSAVAERTMIERAIVAALGRLHRNAGGYLEALDLYNGELAASEEDDLRDRLLGRVPAVLVTGGRETFTGRSIRRTALEGTLEVEVIVISGHLRSREARAHGDEVSLLDPRADPGVNRILSDCRRLLHGRDLGVTGVQAPTLRAHDPNLKSAALTIFTARYEVDYRFDQLPLDPGRPAESIEHRHNVAGGAPVNPVLTGEATP